MNGITFLANQLFQIAAAAVLEDHIPRVITAEFVVHVNDVAVVDLPANTNFLASELLFLLRQLPREDLDCNGLVVVSAHSLEHRSKGALTNDPQNSVVVDAHQLILSFSDWGQYQRASVA